MRLVSRQWNFVGTVKKGKEEAVSELGGGGVGAGWRSLRNHHMVPDG